jgi:PTH1 family peptidyl-tRNA hydrolase
MLAVFGLGNPGEKYSKTRHNAGFIILDELAKNKGMVWASEPKFKAETAKDGDLLLIKPLTHMNNSGESASAVVNFYKLSFQDIMVVHDEVDLEFGRIKKQLGGSSAGHHGIEDIIEKLGTTEFWRIRVGVGRPVDKRFDVMDWVLSDFSEYELEFIKREGQVAIHE